MSRFASIALALASRLATVPSGQPSWRGDLLAGPALQVAQDDDGPVVVRQAAQLLVQQGLQVGPPVLLRGLGVGHLRHLHFPRPPPGGGPPRLQRRLVGDPVQPVADHLPRRDGRRLADEDEEGGLEGVLGVVVAQQAAAHAPHHRAVPLDEGGEGRLVAALDEAAEQFAVAKPAPSRSTALRRCSITLVVGLVGMFLPRRASRPALYLLSAARR